MIVIACGDRHASSEAARRLAFDTLNAIHNEVPITMLKQGCAKGFDTFAMQWAIQHGIKVKGFPADWNKFGSSAGPIRNHYMALSGADLCVCFPGGEGTADMKDKAQRAGIKIMEVGYSS